MAQTVLDNRHSLARVVRELPAPVATAVAVLGPPLIAYLTVQVVEVALGQPSAMFTNVADLGLFMTILCVANGIGIRLRRPLVPAAVVATMGTVFALVMALTSRNVLADWLPWLRQLVSYAGIPMLDGYLLAAFYRARDGVGSTPGSRQG